MEGDHLVRTSQASDLLAGTVELSDSQLSNAPYRTSQLEIEEEMIKLLTLGDRERGHASAKDEEKPVLD